MAAEISETHFYEISKLIARTTQTVQFHVYCTGMILFEMYTLMLVLLCQTAFSITWDVDELVREAFTGDIDFGGDTGKLGWSYRIATDSKMRLTPTTITSEYDSNALVINIQSLKIEVPQGNSFIIEVKPLLVGDSTTLTVSGHLTLKNAKLIIAFTNEEDHDPGQFISTDLENNLEIQGDMLGVASLLEGTMKLLKDSFKERICNKISKEVEQFSLKVDGENVKILFALRPFDSNDFVNAQTFHNNHYGHADSLIIISAIILSIMICCNIIIISRCIKNNGTEFNDKIKDMIRVNDEIP